MPTPAEYDVTARVTELERKSRLTLDRDLIRIVDEATMIATPEFLEQFPADKKEHLLNFLPKFITNIHKRTFVPHLSPRIPDLSERTLEHLVPFHAHIVELAFHYLNGAYWAPFKCMSLIVYSAQTGFYLRYGRGTATRSSLTGLVDLPTLRGIMRPLADLAEVSRYFVQTAMCFFERNRMQILFDKLMTVPQEWNPPACYVKFLIKPFVKYCGLMAPGFLARYAPAIFERVSAFLTGLSEERVKSEEKKCIQTIITDAELILHRVTPDRNAACLQVERLALTVAYKMFTNKQLEKRLMGIKDIADFCYLVPFDTAYKNVYEANYLYKIEALTPPMLVKWLREQRVLELCFGENVHTAILAKSNDVVRFLVKANALTPADVDLMWGNCVGKHETVVQQTVTQLAEMASWLQLPECERLFEHIAQVPLEEMTAPMVRLLKAVTSQALLKGSFDAAKKKGPAKPKLYGVPILWDLVQDACPVSYEVFNTALGALAELFAQTPLHPHRAEFMARCIEGLRAHQTVAPLLRLLHRMAGPFRGHLASTAPGTVSTTPPLALTLPTGIDDGRPGLHQAARGPQRTVLNELETKYHVVDLFIDDLRHYKAAAAELKAKMQIQKQLIAGHVAHGMQISTRLDFMEYFLLNSEAVLTSGHMEALWDLCVLGAFTNDEQRGTLGWFEKILQAGSKVHLAENAAQDLFVDKFGTLPPERITESAFGFCQYCFRLLNQTRGALRAFIPPAPATTSYVTSPAPPTIYQVAGEDLLGVNFIWNMVLGSEAPVAAKARELLIQLHTVFTPEMKAQVGEMRVRFIDRVMKELAEGAQRLQATGPEAPARAAVELRIERCVDLLKTFMEDFEASLTPDRRAALRKHGRGDAITLTVRFYQLADFPLVMNTRDTVTAIKKALADASKVAPELIRLNWGSTELADGTRTIEELHLKERSILNAFRRDPKTLPASAVAPARDPAPTPIPDEESLYYPNSILDAQHYFDQLFGLLNLGSSFAQKAWELLMRMPTNTKMLHTIENIQTQVADWNEILDHRSIFRLTYALQVVDTLVPDDQIRSSGRPLSALRPSLNS
ncbi:putative ubiquitin hydrolase [Paratrimastix pyriformis]|uniref:Ubiquitin hydrolase n=1 Tax=Paratrimastix pyriformis TaxID=342808 RepID=A0ABQ8UTZ8_9EUKA|nr:putative ubiquitin hydrolase [Paratrimastix pyriformis]